MSTEYTYSDLHQDVLNIEGVDLRFSVDQTTPCIKYPYQGPYNGFKTLNNWFFTRVRTCIDTRLEFNIYDTQGNIITNYHTLLSNVRNKEVINVYTS